MPRIEHALGEVADLRERLEELAAQHQRPHTECVADVVQAVGTLLRCAEQAALGVDPKARWWLARWWSGDQLVATYQPLHAAKVHLVDLYDAQQVDAATPAATERAARYLDRGDLRRVAAEQLPTIPAAERRAALRAAREAGYEASDLDHHQQRTFRNALAVATVLSLILMLVVGGLLFAKPQFAPLCFDSVNQEAATPATGSTGTDANVVTTTEQVVCPSGAAAERAPNGWDVVLVLLFGVVGAGLAAAVTVRNLTVTTSPYDVPLVLSLLKLPLGALTAVVGVMAIRGSLVPGLSSLDSPAEILTYAVVLGYAQQLATGFLDRRAQTLGKSDPS